MSQPMLRLPSRSLRWLQVLITLAVIGAGFAVVGRIGFAVLLGVVDIPGNTFVGAPAVPLPAVDRLEETPPVLVSGVSVNANRPVPLVLENPSSGAAALALLGQVPTTAVYLIFFVLLRGLVKAARRTEVFTEYAAGRVRLLGAILLVGAPLAAVVEAVLHGLLSRTVTTNEAFAYDWDTPGYAIISGLGLLVIAEVVRRGVEMRKDLEGTV
jgi:hypothetical protein